jgi:hypothetical protein
LNHQLARNAANNFFYSGGSTPTSQPMSSEFSLEKHDTNVLYSSHNSQDYLNDYIQNHRVPLPEISSESNNEDGELKMKLFFELLTYLSGATSSL